MRWKNRLTGSRPWSIGSDAVRCFFAHEGMMIAGYLAYMGLLSLFPFMIFLVALAGFLGDTQLGTTFAGLMMERLPVQVSDALQPPLQHVLQDNRPGLMTFSILLSIWVSMAGLNAVRAALNRAFHVRARRAIWKRLLHSLASTILAALCILIAMLVVVVSPTILEILDSWLLLPDGWQVFAAYEQWLVPPALLFGAAVVLYWNFCSADMHWRIVWPGALFTVAMWMLAARGLSLYLAHFNRFPTTYGSLGGAVLLLIFFYILAAIFLLGAELNAALMRSRNEEAQHQPD